MGDGGAAFFEPRAHEIGGVHGGDLVGGEVGVTVFYIIGVQVHAAQVDGVAAHVETEPGGGGGGVVAAPVGHVHFDIGAVFGGDLDDMLVLEDAQHSGTVAGVVEVDHEVGLEPDLVGVVVDGDQHRVARKLFEIVRHTRAAAQHSGGLVMVAVEEGT